MKNEVEIRTVNIHGQVCIGKEFAKQQVQIVRQDDSSIVIRKGQFIPDNEKWLYQGDNIERLHKAIAESKSTLLTDNFEEVKKKILSNE